MKMQLSAEVMTAFYTAETAIKRVLDLSTFQWGQLGIKAEEMPPIQETSTEETLFTFRGYIFTPENHFSILSTVRMKTDCDKNEELLFVDVLYEHANSLQMVDGRTVYTPAEGEHCYTMFVDQSGELTEAVY